MIPRGPLCLDRALAHQLPGEVSRLLHVKWKCIFLQFFSQNQSQSPTPFFLELVVTEGGQPQRKQFSIHVPHRGAWPEPGHLQKKTGAS